MVGYIVCRIYMAYVTLSEKSYLTNNVYPIRNMIKRLHPYLVINEDDKALL